MTPRTRRVIVTGVLVLLVLITVVAALLQAGGAGSRARLVSEGQPPQTAVAPAWPTRMVQITLITPNTTLSTTPTQCRILA